MTLASEVKRAKRSSDPSKRKAITKKPKKPSVDDTILYGLEMEFARPNQSSNKSLDLNRDLQTAIESAYSDLDASGRDGGGVEVKTQPYNFKYWRKEGVKLLQFLSIPKKHKYTGENNTSGMHIHVDRNILSYKEFKVLVTFVANNMPLMKHVSRRGTRIAFISPNTTEGKTHAPANTITEPMYDNINVIGNHCIVLNYQSNKRTIEFRFFNSTLDPLVVLASIEFIRALIYFVKSNREKTTSNFLSYIEDYSDKYNNLISQFMVNFTL